MKTQDSKTMQNQKNVLKLWTHATESLTNCQNGEQCRYYPPLFQLLSWNALKILHVSLRSTRWRTCIPNICPELRFCLDFLNLQAKSTWDTHRMNRSSAAHWGLAASQRIAEWLRSAGTSGDIWPNTLPQAGPPRASWPGPHPGGFWTSPRRRFHNLTGNLHQSSNTCTAKYFLMFRRNLLHPSLCPLPLVPRVGTTENSTAPPSLHPPFRSL